LATYLPPNEQRRGLPSRSFTAPSTPPPVGGKARKLAEIADEPIVIDAPRYRRAEDAHMAICHMLCYAFIEHPEWAGP
jgi:hypothetical protein